MTHFLLIRHATTDAVGKRLVGRTPGIHLNETGQAQAQELASRLVDLPVAAIYSSPLERTMETAEIIAKPLHLEVVACNNFLEIDFGDWMNVKLEELIKLPHFQYFNTFRSSTRIPGGELMLEAQNRIVTGLEQLRHQHLNEIVAIVSHSDMIKAALAYYMGMPIDLMQRIEISPASVSMITIYHETARILRINDTGIIHF